MESIEEWRLSISVLGCPINCKWLISDKLGNWCCMLGRKINVTLREEDNANDAKNRKKLLGEKGSN